MKKRSLSNELVLAATVGMLSLGCQVTSSDSSGSGGKSGGGDGGTTSAGGAGGSAGGAGGSGAGGTSSSKTFDSSKPPCDIYKEDGGPCVAAHSTVRVLLSSYTGPLYQVAKTDGTTKDIGSVDGFAKASDQDDYCGEDRCTISIIYDQSGQGNHLTKAPAGQAKKTPAKEADAKGKKITISGHDLYGEHNPAGVGYRNNAAKGTATGDHEQTVYAVVGGDYYNAGCCFDYGNAETNSADNGEGTMEAVYFGNCTVWNQGDGDGPWIMGDLENGLWAGNEAVYTNNKPVNFKYVTGIVKGDKAGQNHWVIKVGNAQEGTLNKPYDGKRPSDRYNPMRKEGAIILGTGGDNSNIGQGDFFEGIMTAHFSSDAADDAVQANIVSVYGK
jgi:non-reducing end alpha-L-arabinofuranosidase